MENDKDYVNKLEALPEKQRAAFLYGDWDALEGQFFDEFDKDKHVIEPFPIPTRWRRYRVRDYGFDMLACLWVAVDERDNAYVYKELYEPNLVISAAGERINEVNGNDDIWLDLAPPDLFARNRQDYRTTVDVFREENGHYLTKASNDRVNGWSTVREWLKDVEYEILDGNGNPVTIKHPKLRIFKNCTNLIRCLPLLVYSEKDPNDCANKPHEITHAPDALRYWCSSWSFAPEGLKVEEEKDWFTRTLEENFYKTKKRSFVEDYN